MQKVTGIGVFSLAKFQGFFGAIMGFLIGLFYAAIARPMPRPAPETIATRSVMSNVSDGVIALSLQEIEPARGSLESGGGRFST